MPPRYVYPFAYLLPPRDRSRHPRSFQIRDAVATLEVVSALASRGYAYGGLLLNYPPPPGGQSDTMLKIKCPAGSLDLLLTMTRPPMNPDYEGAEKKRVGPGQTDIEAHVIRLWERYFRLLIRPEMELADDLCGDLLPGYEDRRHVVFYQLEGSRYQDLGPRKYKGPPRTAAFLLRARELWPGGPGYLGCFGMDGTASLVWANLLRTRYSDLLDEPGFTMAELTMGDIPKRTGDLSFAESWHAEFILHRAL